MNKPPKLRELLGEHLGYLYTKIPALVDKLDRFPSLEKFILPLIMLIIKFRSAPYPFELENITAEDKILWRASLAISFEPEDLERLQQRLAQNELITGLEVLHTNILDQDFNPNRDPIFKINLNDFDLAGVFETKCDYLLLYYIEHLFAFIGPQFINVTNLQDKFDSDFTINFNIQQFTKALDISTFECVLPNVDIIDNQHTLVPMIVTLDKTNQKLRIEIQGIRSQNSQAELVENEAEIIQKISLEIINLIDQTRIELEQHGSKIQQFYDSLDCEFNNYNEQVNLFFTTFNVNLDLKSEILDILDDQQKSIYVLAKINYELEQIFTKISNPLQLKYIQNYQLFNPETQLLTKYQELDRYLQQNFASDFASYSFSKYLIDKIKDPILVQQIVEKSIGIDTYLALQWSRADKSNNWNDFSSEIISEASILLNFKLDCESKVKISRKGTLNQVTELLDSISALSSELKHEKSAQTFVDNLIQLFNQRKILRIIYPQTNLGLSEFEGKCIDVNLTLGQEKFENRDYLLPQLSAIEMQQFIKNLLSNTKKPDILMLLQKYFTPQNVPMDVFPYGAPNYSLITPMSVYAMLYEPIKIGDLRVKRSFVQIITMIIHELGHLAGISLFGNLENTIGNETVAVFFENIVAKTLIDNPDFTEETVEFLEDRYIQRQQKFYLEYYGAITRFEEACYAESELNEPKLILHCNQILIPAYNSFYNMNKEAVTNSEQLFQFLDIIIVYLTQSTHGSYTAQYTLGQNIYNSHYVPDAFTSTDNPKKYRSGDITDMEFLCKKIMTLLIQQFQKQSTIQN